MQGLSNMWSSGRCRLKLLQDTIPNTLEWLKSKRLTTPRLEKNMPQLEFSPKLNIHHVTWELLPRNLSKKSKNMFTNVLVNRKQFKCPSVRYWIKILCHI